MVEDLLPDHVELLHVLNFAAHLVYLTWIGLQLGWGFGLGLDNKCKMGNTD